MTLARRRLTPRRWVLYLITSKNRITDETLKLLLQLAKKRNPACERGSIDV